MLDYKNIISAKDKEVRDPVSGYSYPMSVNDMHAERANQESQKEQSALAALITSMIK